MRLRPFERSNIAEDAFILEEAISN